MATISGGRNTAKAGPKAQAAPFSCNCCQVAFRNSDLQRSHMKSDWHRYNIKRRVTSLAPISSEVYAERVLQAQASEAAEMGKATFEHVCRVCQKTYYSENSYQNHLFSQKHKARAALVGSKGVPSKAADDASSVLSSTFSLGEPNQRAVASEANSQMIDSDVEEEFSQVVKGLKKASLQAVTTSPVKRPDNPRLSAAAQHKQEQEHPLTPAADANGAATESSSATATATATASATPTPSKTSTAEPEHSLKLCLFCNYASPTLQLNVAHMERFHSMFIPEKPYLVDVEGLLAHLETRVRDDHECIYCGKVRADVFAVQTHMRDKAHCKIPYMTLEEQVDIGDFYDFRSSYSDGEEDDDEEDGKGNGRNEDREDDGWETDSSASSLDSADLTAVPADNHITQYERLEKHPHHSQTDTRSHHQRDGWHSHAHKHNHAIYYDEYELHLPSGRSVGHRAHNRYFRQNLYHYPSMEERVQLALENGDAEGAAVSSSAALTRTGEAAGSRAVSKRPAPRNIQGLAGVSDKTKRSLLKTERLSVARQITAVDKGRIKFSANSIGQSFRFLGR